ncbi:MAG: glycoside hydrolase family 2 TIM barrel-domain containing protein [Gracilimonas sp.]|nr:glycoside hydrolase family 2 TIM barrel-domain containing protein [Gracilimonas sp.]
MYVTFFLFLFFYAGLLTVNSESKGPSKVQIEENDGSFTLLVDNEPFFVKGAGGDQQMDKLSAYGGNSIRTWSTHNAKKILDKAHENGIMVTLGLWVGHERHGFDYDNEEAVRSQLESFTEEVEKYKDHPALLMWAVGNEMELNAKNNKVWYAINDIAKMIKKKDPNHPTMTVVAEISKQKIKYLNERVPDVDILGVNSYRGIDSVPQRIRKFGWERPYMITEWGPNGHWEVPKTTWDAPIEQTSSEKAAVYKSRYENVIAADKELCLGSYVFLWGQKQERTSTWYGLFLETGEETEVVDVMNYVWSGEWPENRSPQITSALRINDQLAKQNVRLKSKTIGKSAIELNDPDDDKLKIDWLITHESTDLGVGGDAESKPKEIPGLINSSDFEGNASFTTPDEPGAYRLFVFVYDGHGNAGTANIPFYVYK